MTISRRTLGVLTLAVLLVLPAAGAARADGHVAGDWEGSMSAGGTSLRILFHVTEAEDGTLSATLDSPDQGAFGVPFDSATFEEGELKLALAAAQASFAGTLSEDGNTLSGTWTQGGQGFPLELSRQE